MRQNEKITNNQIKGRMYGYITVVLFLLTISIAGCMGIQASQVNEQDSVTPQVLTIEPDVAVTLEYVESKSSYQEHHEKLPKPTTLLSPGSRCNYQDKGKNNDISFALLQSTTLGSFFFNTKAGSITVNPPPGNRLVLLSLKVCHLGSRSVSDQQITTPGLPSFKLYDSYTSYSPKYISNDDGSFIESAHLNRFDEFKRPVYPWTENIVHHTSIGELYSETILNRKEVKEGWLLFVVPEGFSIQEAYLRVEIDSLEEAFYWSLS